MTQLDVVLEAIRYIQLLKNKIIHNLSHTHAQQQIGHLEGHEQVCENLQENHLPVQNSGSQRTLENFHQTVQWWN